MRKLLSTIAAIALLAGTAAPAFAAEGWYGRVDVGYSVDGHVTLDNEDFGLDNDWLGDVGIGYGFQNGFRLEEELAYRTNEFEEFTQDDVNTTSLMTNLFYDFNRGGRWQPYVGVGAGYAKVDISLDDDSGFAWQALAGLGYALSDRATLDVGYRFFKVPELDLLGDPDAEYEHQAVTVGLRWDFAPPAPPAPAYVPPPQTPPPTVTPPPPACPTSEFTVYFEWDRSNLNAQATDVIDQAVARARQCNLTAATVVGHTDTSGSTRYNVGLSERRASVVRDALVARGLPAAAITTDARGETDLARPTRDGVREPLNRRTAVNITFH